MMLGGKIMALAISAIMPFAALPLASYPEPTSYYANDFADVLSAETEQAINDQSRVLDEKTGAQVVVVTVSSLEGETVEDYALELGRKWGVGGEKENNGLLVLLAPNERKVNISVGYGLEGAINDAKAGRLLDQYAVPYFKNDGWDTGIQNVYHALLSEVYTENGLEYTGEAPVGEEESSSEEGDIFSDLFMYIILAAMIYALFSRHHGGGRRGPTIWLGGGSGGSSGSSRSGGGFSGGGGSFGGGGASRGF